MDSYLRPEEDEYGEESFWDKFNPLTGSYRKNKPLSVKAAEVVAENAPITGSTYTAADISDELDKEDPSKLKIAGLMGAEVLGAVPFVGDAAQSLIRKGLKAKGYGEASDETVGLMREKYPNMEAREETYRIAERPDPKTGETDIKVGPEQELEEVPTYPEAPERSSVFIDPSRARVEYDGEYRNTVIPTKGALYIEDIVEQSDDVLYRGMSAEEYRGALEQGYIKSKGDYNIGDEQEGLTFFSTRPSQAQSYANNFTPEGFKATPDRPAYVVGIKKPKKIDYITGDTEMGLKGQIPTSDIVEVFEGKPYQFKSDVVIQTDFGNEKKVHGTPDRALVTWEKLNAPSDVETRGFDEGGLMVETSPRPKSRPKTVLPYEDADKIERLVWAEARGEGVEGRNAVRGVIFNRLASSRFPDTVDELLTADEFEPIRKYGDVYSIPVPEEDLQQGHAEFADYYQMGEDAVDGRTFFQNTATTKARGTDFSGPDPITIGKHTFTRGYEGQEPVYDTDFSHNITITYPEYAEAGGMALGGLAVARKGIMTPEGEDMANNKFQLDENKADTNNDGSLSAYEKTRAEAVQKATSEEEELDMYHGGMMGPVDPVSGNPIPVGSSAEEVRDDIDINISQGEYVLPADVVKWHGLKHIMDLQEEAKMGLMAMDAMGLIKEADEETAEEEGEVCPKCDGTGCDHCDGTGYHYEEEATPEGEVVEEAVVEVSEEEPEVNETDDYKDSDYSKKTSMYGMVKKPKVTFIV